jgi:hypothetical protein
VQPANSQAAGRQLRHVCCEGPGHARLALVAFVSPFLSPRSTCQTFKSSEEQLRHILTSFKLL